MRSLLVITLSLCCQFSFAQEMSQYKGHRELDKKIFTHVFQRSFRHQNLNSFLASGGFGFGGSLLDLIGFYDMGLNNGKISNGDPNAISLLIHYLIFSEMSTIMQKDCTISNDPILSEHYHENFLEILVEICDTPSDQEIADKVFFPFWIALHGFQTPKTEFDEWKSYIQSQKYQSHENQLAEMSLVALMNPFFFLQN